MTIPIRIKHNCKAQWNDDCDITTAKCSRDFDVLTIIMMMIMMMITMMMMAFVSHTSQYQDG
jgi:hypothetical protein